MMFLFRWGRDSNATTRKTQIGGMGEEQSESLYAGLLIAFSQSR